MRRRMRWASGNGLARKPLGQRFHVFALAAADQAAKFLWGERQGGIIGEAVPQARLPEKPSNQIRKPPHARSLAPATNLFFCE